MSVEVTPRGTRGFEPPKLARPLMSAMMGLGIFAHRVLGDRMRVIGRPLLLLKTVGARSGETRTSLLGWFPDSIEGSWLVVASFGGAARHPAWFLNMARNPDKVWVEIGERKLQVQPESLSGADRAEAWQRIVSLAPGYAGYQEKTDREIPVVRLRPVDATAGA